MPGRAEVVVVPEVHDERIVTQLELAGRCLAMFSAVIGRSYSPNVISPPSFSFPKAADFLQRLKALSSINPSRLGDTLRMKVQYALLKGIRFSLTIHSGDFTSVVGKSLSRTTTSSAAGTTRPASGWCLWRCVVRHSVRRDLMSV